MRHRYGSTTRGAIDRESLDCVLQIGRLHDTEGQSVTSAPAARGCSAPPQTWLPLPPCTFGRTALLQVFNGRRRIKSYIRLAPLREKQGSTSMGARRRIDP